MVFQNFGLRPWAPVMGNVEFPLEIDGMGAAERRDRVARFHRTGGARRLCRALSHELSGVMQQRVGIARALMRKPILIFMDEPFGRARRPDARAAAGGLPRDMSRTGATVVFVTQQS